MDKTSFEVRRENLEVVMTRVFDAPREKVYAMFTDPNLIPKWWGPSAYTTVVEKHDFVVGGKWRFIQKDNDGNKFAFSGEFKEIVPNEKVSDTFEYEPMAGHILIETSVFEDTEDGRTKVTATSKYANIEDLDGMVQSGMEGGAKEGWERLAALIEK